MFRLGEKVVSVGFDEQRDRVYAKLESGKNIHGQGLLYTIGRQANCDLLNVGAAGLAADARQDGCERALPDCGFAHLCRRVTVIGFPALASTSMEQGPAGKLVTCHGQPGKMPPNLIPYGIYTIPEISMVGQTEEQLTKDKIPYEVGLARYAELAKGQMLGDEQGLVKILFDPNSLRLLGVHIIGDRAAEIVHIGQAVLSMGGTIEYFRDTVFNYPTLAEAYKVAALDGLNKL